MFNNPFNNLDTLRNNVYWINPARISFYVPKSSFPYVVKRRVNKTRFSLVSKFFDQPLPFIISEQAFSDIRQPVESVVRYQIISDFIQNIDNYEQSIWFKKLVTDLHQKGEARHKKLSMTNLDEVHAFFNGYVIALYESLIADGFDLSKGKDVAKVYIDADGDILKGESGFHRFAIARIVGIKKMPVRVQGVHALWADGVTAKKPLAAKIDQYFSCLGVSASSS
ncbi:hypothetical protein [Thiomicrospira cyclica]|uniref:Uncharacterized protein n=1 Tax=Thiomicrospira cyclica (strain DSM 14477 / JCM 11371 / ALM1) TaxID=717773 RepID=F6DCW5_THICA|nr:hypothetical protein [Thiomicrospira cyclica]AEG31701.1 hypothetical protein Thicy_0934 [Thiomicrospira cyclica ALM1]